MQAQCPLHSKPARLPEARCSTPASVRCRQQRRPTACRADAADRHSSSERCSVHSKLAKARQRSEPAQPSSLAAVPAFLAGTISSLTSLGGGGGRGGNGVDGSSGGGGDGSGPGPATEDVGFASSNEEDRCGTAQLLHFSCKSMPGCSLAERSVMWQPGGSACRASCL